MARSNHISFAATRSGLLSLLLTLPLLATAQDQTSEVETDELVLEEVIVTGSHIAGLDEELLPVTVMTAEAIEQLGAINMRDILSYIPSVSDFDFEDTNNGTNGARGDVSGVNLRGLGSSNTLVLLNGRRMVVHPTFQAINNTPQIFYNVNSVPSPAIERIEVLRDGAAPLYGADAIAGVINFVPYMSYDGMKFTGKYGWSEDTSMDEMEFTAAGGWEFNDGKSHLSVFASYYDRSHVHMNELGELYYELDRRELPEIPEEWRGDSQLRNTSTLTPWARFRVGALNSGGQFIGPTRHIDSSTGEIANGSGSERYNFNETAWVTPATDRFNFMATYTQEIDNGVEFFADAYYYEASSTTQRAASPLDDSLAFLIVPPGAYYNPYPDQEVLIIGWRPTDLGPRIIDVDQDSYRLLGGFRGDAGGWDWETAFLYSEAESTDSEGNRQAKSLFQQQLLVDGPDALNPFAGPGGNSQAALDGIRISSTDVRTSTLALADLRLSKGDWFQTFGNDAGVAMGLEYRNESYDEDRDARLDGSMPFDSGAIFDESDVIGVSATFDSEASRNTYSAYAELYLPLVGEANAMTGLQAFEVQLAARYENSNDFDSTLKPKIGFRWAPIDALSIRGSYTEGFRAPNLPQMNQGTVIRRIDGIEDPLRADVTGAPIDTGDTYRVTTREANNNLEPEDAETWLLGFVFSPSEGALSGLRIGLDWWQIKQQDIVGILEPEDALDLDVILRQQGSSNPDVIRAAVTAQDLLLFEQWNLENPNDQRTPVGVATNILNQYINLDPREVQGWDGSFVYATDETSAGQFTLRWDFTKYTKFEQQGLATEDLLRRNGNPKLRYTLALNWGYRAFNANASMRYTSSAYDTSLSMPISSGVSGTYNEELGLIYWDVASWTIYNVAFSYDFSEIGNSLDGLQLMAGVRNLTNEDPPFADESYGYFTHLHNSYGRVWWFEVGYSF